MNRNELAEEIVDKALLKEFFFIAETEFYGDFMVSLLNTKWPATLEGYNKLYETISDILKNYVARHIENKANIEVLFSDGGRGLALLKMKPVSYKNLSDIAEIEIFLNPERQLEELKSFGTNAHYGLPL